jgi:hypothetical protein
MKKHTVTISNNFVRNVKRMWDSPFAAYKEIIQNALRGPSLWKTTGRVLMILALC